MLRMRSQRRGKKNYATYRVVVADRGAPVKGKFVADLGPYNPHTDAFGVDKEVALDWLSRGVQPSATVHNLLVDHGILKADKMTSWRPKKQVSDDEAAAGADTNAAAETSDDKATDESTAKAKTKESSDEKTDEKEEA